uniref:Uncharacterized protein n=1 Tax=Anopheles minimus TaxID=112268 RepID=A0A182WP68_9DIPT
MEFVCCGSLFLTLAEQTGLSFQTGVLPVHAVTFPVRAAVGISSS